MKHLKSTIRIMALGAIVAVAFTTTTQAQIQVIDTFTNASINQLAQSLVGQGITISNVTYTCEDSALGSFRQGNNSNIGLDQGVVLTSGALDNIIGPNDQGGASTGHGNPGDSDLDQLTTSATEDACILEFDLIPTGDTVKFDFVFASEEYPEFVCDIYNDVFGFFISGPGISGPYSAPVQFPNGAANMALVPGTTTQITINNLNNGNPNNPSCTPTNTQFYFDNGDGDCWSTPLPPSCTDSTIVQYDGFTVPLTAKAAVTPCQSYHLKIAIADAGDDALDSGVFIEKGSLVSTEVDLVATVNSVLFDFAVEGCLNGSIDFIKQTPGTDTLVIKFTIAGTAQNSVDYAKIADSIVFYPGDTIQSIPIVPVLDGIADDNETVTLYLLDDCFGLPFDSATIHIRDQFETDVVPDDTTICEGQNIFLNDVLDTNFVFTWTPNYNLDCNNCATPIASPIMDTTYVVNVNYVAGCQFNDTIHVNVNNIFVDAGPNLFLCSGTGDSIQFLSSASNVDTIRWTPTNALNNPNIITPKASPATTTTYFVTVSDTIGCSRTDSLVLTVDTALAVDPGPDTTICLGDSYQILAAGGGNFSWSPATGLDATNIPNPVASPLITTTYQVIISSPLCPSDTGYIEIAVDSMPFVELRTDTLLCLGDSLQLTPTIQTALNFSWNTEFGLDDTTQIDPWAKPDSTVTYIFGGYWGICSDFDTLEIQVFTVSAGNDSVRFCLGDSIQLNVVSASPTYNWTPGIYLSDSTIANPMASPPSRITFEVEITNGVGCTDIDSILVYVDSLNVNDVIPDATICIGEVVNLTTTGSGSINYDWSPGVGLSDSTAKSPNASPSATTTYTLISSNNFCNPDTDMVTITVNPLPIITSSNDTAVCMDSVANIWASGGVQYIWTPGDPYLNDSLIANPVAMPIGTTTYHVTVMDTNGCVNYDSVTVSVNSPPDPDLTQDRVMCTETSITIGPVNQNAQWNYTWSPIDGLSDPNNANPSLTLSADSISRNVSYYLTIVDENGCISFDTLDVTVSPYPVADAGPDITIVRGASAELQGSGTGDIFSWDPIDGLSDPTIANPQAGPTGPMEYILTVESGCGEAMDTMMVSVIGEPTISVPMAFTPNQDGRNDVIYAQIAGDYGLGSFSIFNRWGELIFYTEDITIGWDGTFRGKKQPIETYVFIAVAIAKNGDRITTHGSFTLVR